MGTVEDNIHFPVTIERYLTSAVFNMTLEDSNSDDFQHNVYWLQYFKTLAKKKSQIKPTSGHAVETVKNYAKERNL